MYLNNSLIAQGICNSTISVVTDVNLQDQYARVAFSTRGFIVNIDIYKQTHYFELNGSNCRHMQFPLQNRFTLSRCPTWDNIKISHLDTSAFITDQYVISEYRRLVNISDSNPHLFS